jgi:predicted transcriptional regulator
MEDLKKLPTHKVLELIGSAVKDYCDRLREGTIEKEKALILHKEVEELIRQAVEALKSEHGKPENIISEIASAILQGIGGEIGEQAILWLHEQFINTL